MAAEDTLAAELGEAGDDGRAASTGPSAGPTAEMLHAAFDVFKAAFDVPTVMFEPSHWTCTPVAGMTAGEDEGEATGEDAMEVAAEQMLYVPAGGGEGGGTSAAPEAMPPGGGR